MSYKSWKGQNKNRGRSTANKWSGMRPGNEMGLYGRYRTPQVPHPIPRYQTGDCRTTRSTRKSNNERNERTHISLQPPAQLRLSHINPLHPAQALPNQKMNPSLRLPQHPRFRLAQVDHKLQRGLSHLFRFEVLFVLWVVVRAREVGGECANVNAPEGTEEEEEGKGQATVSVGPGSALGRMRSGSQ